MQSVEEWDRHGEDVNVNEYTQCVDKWGRLCEDVCMCIRNVCGGGVIMVRMCVCVMCGEIG
jgi:hypothetical protein